MRALKYAIFAELNANWGKTDDFTRNLRGKLNKPRKAEPSAAVAEKPPEVIKNVQAAEALAPENSSTVTGKDSQQHITQEPVSETAQVTVHSLSVTSPYFGRVLR